MKTKFDLFKVIKGVTGSSGLIFEESHLWLISDDSYVLYRYHLQTEILERLNLHPDLPLMENMPKTEKPDFEAVAVVGDSLYIFGSGSVGPRYYRAVVDKSSFKLTALESLKKLYSGIAEATQIGEEDFNIEGIIPDDDTLYLFNRGNGPERKNGVFKVSERNGISRIQYGFNTVLLPKINGVPFGFTDAILVDDQVFFMASAEDTVSTFDDGEILGSGVGILSYPEFELIDFKLLTLNYKLEGITLMKKQDNTLTFLLCEDADDGLPETKVFKLEVRLQ